MDNMQSLYAKYLSEIGNDHIIEEKEGFVTYRFINEKQVYIIDIFVLPEWRNCGIPLKLADKVCMEAKEKGCTELLGTIDPNNPGSTMNLKAQLSFGMSLSAVSHNAIILKKEI